MAARDTGGDVGRRKLGFWRRFAVVLIKPVVTVWTRRTWLGAEELAREGGIIIVPNHLAPTDPIVSAHFIYDNGRWPQYLAKASLFRIPLMGAILHKVQQIPVERGSVEAARSLDRLIAALDAGGAVIIYPEGTITKEPQLWPMRGKTGAARLALATGAPVIPLAMWGPQLMADPRGGGVNLRPRRPVTVAAGAPVDLSRWAGAQPTREVLEEMTDQIMLSVRDLLAEIRGETPPPLWERPREDPRGEVGQPQGGTA